MNKLDREVKRALLKMGVKIAVRYVNRGHSKLIVRLPTGEEHYISMAGTPTNSAHTINNVLRDVRNLSNHRLKGTSP